MTILTHPFSEKKVSQQKEPLVAADAETGVSGEERNDAESTRNPLVVTMMLRSRARRISSLTTLCVFITALLVFTTGIVGGYYLYRQFTQYRLRHFRGWCSIPYAEQQRLEQIKPDVEHGINGPRPSLGDIKSIEDWMRSMSQVSEKKEQRPQIDDFFDEEFDIDIELEQYERIEVPTFAHGRRGRFVHDFSVNKTAIIDLDAGRCFVLPLNRTTVLPPRSLYDLIVKMRTGYYNIDTEIVRDSYRVVFPAITDYKTIGYYIARECGNLPTYELEKLTSGVYKRSVDLDNESKPVFSEFAGHKINEIHITNLHDVPGKK
ncbi:Integral membrane protein 2B-like protein [Leptotrombidium deliense]|uniref:Integral membrane protein 2 n=1 Tax=Leptotrombidium deliense TaxID=299467 RepID=A0A443SU57_9ACAR|nr:Integral membrane protein 2B-like protein [Leptotrombidium deliense]